MFYTYGQNNSGGSFVVNDMVTYTVIIEADRAQEADKRAVEIGIYFDGCDDGLDCHCCGDRWSRAQDWNAADTPLIYGKDPTAHKEIFAEVGEPYCYIYYKDKKATYHKGGKK